MRKMTGLGQLGRGRGARRVTLYLAAVLAAGLLAGCQHSTRPGLTIAPARTCPTGTALLYVDYGQTASDGSPGRAVCTKTESETK